MCCKKHVQELFSEKHQVVCGNPPFPYNTYFLNTYCVQQEGITTQKRKT